MTDAEKREKWLCRLEDYIAQYPVLSKVYVKVVIKWLGLTRFGEMLVGCSLLFIALLIIIAVVLIML